jgi:hypothetical protein
VLPHGLSIRSSNLLAEDWQDINKLVEAATAAGRNRHYVIRRLTLCDLSGCSTQHTKILNTHTASEECRLPPKFCGLITNDASAPGFVDKSDAEIPHQSRAPGICYEVSLSPVFSQNGWVLGPPVSIFTSLPQFYPHSYRATVLSTFIAKPLIAERNVSNDINDNHLWACYWSHHDYHVECNHSSFQRPARNHQLYHSLRDFYFKRDLAWTVDPHRHFNLYLTTIGLLYFFHKCNNFNTRFVNEPYNISNIFHSYGSDYIEAFEGRVYWCRGGCWDWNCSCGCFSCLARTVVISPTVTKIETCWWELLAKSWRSCWKI